MNNNLTEMVFILDMSGSMSNLTQDTVGGYNSLIKTQKEEKGDAKVTTVLFDDRYIVLHDRVDIKIVPEMTTNDYRPLGVTAMLDSIGKTIQSVGQKLAALPEEERPGNVIVTIVTDGYENASMEYTYPQIKDMIIHQKEKYNWVFTFIGANIDTMEVGGRLGIDPRLSKTYTPSAQGTEKLYCATSKAMSYARSVGACGQSVSSMCCVDSLAEILDEVEE